MPKMLFSFERWIKKNQYKLSFAGGCIFLLAMVSMFLQFPEELRGGCVVRLDTLEYDYTQREKEFRKEFNDGFADLIMQINLKNELVQTQLESMYEMRNDQ